MSIDLLQPELEAAQTPAVAALGSALLGKAGVELLPSPFPGGISIGRV